MSVKEPNSAPACAESIFFTEQASNEADSGISGASALSSPFLAAHLKGLTKSRLNSIIGQVSSEPEDEILELKRDLSILNNRTHSANTQSAADQMKSYVSTLK